MQSRFMLPPPAREGVHRVWVNGWFVNGHFIPGYWEQRFLRKPGKGFIWDPNTEQWMTMYQYRLQIDAIDIDQNLKLQMMKQRRDF